MGFLTNIFKKPEYCAWCPNKLGPDYGEIKFLDQGYRSGPPRLSTIKICGNCASMLDNHVITEDEPFIKEEKMPGDKGSKGRKPKKARQSRR